MKSVSDISSTLCQQVASTDGSIWLECFDNHDWAVEGKSMTVCRLTRLVDERSMAGPIGKEAKMQRRVAVDDKMEINHVVIADR